jgi:hypothetical protein
MKMDESTHKLEARRERGVGVSAAKTDEGGWTYAQTRGRRRGCEHRKSGRRRMKEMWWEETTNSEFNMVTWTVGVSTDLNELRNLMSTHQNFCPPATQSPPSSSPLALPHTDILDITEALLR